MRVQKSNRINQHRNVAVLLDVDTILLEDGEEWPYQLTPKDTKIFAPKKLIDEIWYDQKIGEVLKYDGTVIKWRDKCPDRYRVKTSWPNDCKEVNVINSRSYPDDPRGALNAIADWRDWVEDNNGNIIGTLSSTSWSIFKESLSTDTWETPFHGVDGINHPIGGRLLPCRSLWTTFEGDFIQWDLYSAYSRRLSELSFGGIDSSWKEVSLKANFDSMVERGMLVYIEARVHLPGRDLGPLPIRRGQYNPHPLYNISFPNSGDIDGIWSYEEIRGAELSGSRIDAKRAFVHFATGQRYFHYNWYHIIQEGRNNLHGYARGLVKQTGNALWGRYAMRIRPAKTVWRNEDGKRCWIQHPLRTLKRNNCMELADQLCGKIRSDLYGFAISANGNLIQGNTDGAWVEYKEGWLPPSDDWRIKRRTIRLDIIDDATYRYWGEGSREPTYIVPGIATDFTEQYFDRKWEKHFAERTH